MPLPFGLKLKRARRYTVSSKSCLVTRIQLLNGEFVEFTLSVESTGQECLEAVAQRLELREVCMCFFFLLNATQVPIVLRFTISTESVLLRLLHSYPDLVCRNTESETTSLSFVYAYHIVSYNPLPCLSPDSSHRCA